MSQCLLRVSLALAALATAASSAFAADMLPPPPPPVEELRPATYDWSGPFIGGLAAATCVDSYYIPSAGPDPELSGCGFTGGFIAGANYQMDNLVIGVEGDWSWGKGKIAENTLDVTEYELDSFATLRARMGYAMDDTLVYLTGGVAWANATMTGGFLVPPAPGVLFFDDDSQGHMGWTIGGGIEHAVTDQLHLRLEYLYADLGRQDYAFTHGCGCGGTADLDLNVHTIRAGLTWNFSSMW